MKKTGTIIAIFIILGIVANAETPTDSIEVVKAEYGTEGYWRDVTGLIREKIKNGVLALPINNAMLGDPAPAMPKTLRLKLKCNGKETLLFADESSTININAASLARSKVSLEGWTIQKAIDDAYRRGDKSLVLKPAVYRIALPEGRGWHLRFSGMKDFILDATGSTFVLEGRNAGGMLFENCRNVGVKGATMLREIPTFSQGDIIGIASNRTYLEIKIHDGYPTDMNSPFFKQSPILTFFEKDSGKIKSNIIDHSFAIKSIEPIGGNRFRFHLKNQFDKRIEIQVGDMAAWRRYTGGEITCLNCAAMSFSGITIKNSGGLAVFEGRGDGGSYYNYTVTYAEPPKGATQKPLLSGAADGFNSADVRKGAILDKCVWEGIHDDAVNIHGSVSMILAGRDDSVIINANRRAADPKPGDTIQLFDKRSTLQMEAKFVSQELIADYKLPDNYQTPHYARTGNFKFVRMKLDRKVPAEPEGYIINADASGSGYIIRDCMTREHRGRGFLLYSANGIVENCLIERCSNGGIVVAPSIAGWGEGPFASNLIIRNNIIRNVSFATENWNNGLTIGGMSNGSFIPLPGGHRNILIEGNRFENISGPNMMISAAIGVTVRNNIFINPMRDPYHGLKPLVNPGALISLGECKDVKFEGNKIIHPGPFMKMIVEQRANVFANGITNGFTV